MQRAAARATLRLRGETDAGLPETGVSHEPGPLSHIKEQIMSDRKPNILILWGDDIGWWNISYNSRGQMGYHPTSTASQMKASPSPTTTASRVARQAAPPSSPARTPCAPA